MSDIELKDRGLLLRFTGQELERIDVARGAMSRGRWVRALVLDGLLARNTIDSAAPRAVRAQGDGGHGALDAGATEAAPVVEGAEAVRPEPPRGYLPQDGWRNVRPPRSGVFGKGVPDGGGS